MKVAVITLTKGGLHLAEKLIRFNENIDIYTHKEKREYTKLIKLPLHDNIKQLMNDYDILIFIMATGIVVRLIAPFIKHKSIDPGIIVMDEEGKYVISLLSGHLGGANEYTNKLADFLDASPVITTASDVKNTIAVDVLAMKLGCYIDNFNNAKAVTSHIVNGENVGLLSSIDINIQLPSQIIIINDNNIKQSIKEHNLKGIIVIEHKDIKVNCEVVYLYKKDIVVGIGCRRGKTKEEILNVLVPLIQNINHSMKSILKLSTVEVKKDEIGILELTKSLNVPLDIISTHEIKKVQHLFEGSDFVEKTIGVTCVSEPCGYISSNKGKCIVKKVKDNGITISLWKANMV